MGPRASHLDRGQGPGGCAGGSGEVGGAGCRHFRSSPSLLSTCCCVGPASTERAGQPPLRRDLGLSRRAEPPSGGTRCPSLCTCAALRDQLAGPLGDGVHGAEGPPRAPLERTLSPPRPPARGQVPRPLLKIALGVRRGRCRFNRQPNAAGKGRVRYTPPALKGPARLGMARRHAAGAVLQLLGSLIPPCAARPGRTRWNQRSAPLAQGRGSVFRPGAHVRRAVVRPGELWDTQSIGEALAQGTCRVSGDVPRSQHPCH